MAMDDTQIQALKEVKAYIRKHGGAGQNQRDDYMGGYP